MDNTTGLIIAAGMAASNAANSKAVESAVENVREELRKQNEALKSELMRASETKEERERALRLRNCINKNDIIKTYIKNNFIMIKRIPLELKVLDKAREVNEKGQYMYLVTVSDEKTETFFTAQIHPKIWNNVRSGSSLYFDDVYEDIVVEVDEKTKLKIQEYYDQKFAISILETKPAYLIDKQNNLRTKIGKYLDRGISVRIAINRLILGILSTLSLLIGILGGIFDIAPLAVMGCIAWVLLSLIFVPYICSNDKEIDHEALRLTAKDYSEAKEEYNSINTQLNDLEKQIINEKAKLQKFAEDILAELLKEDEKGLD